MVGKYSIERTYTEVLSSIAGVGLILASPLIKVVETKNLDEVVATKSEIIAALKETNQYQEFLLGKILCKHCGKAITFENLGVVESDEKKRNELRFYCRNPGCTLR
jgi:hypothetical protein